MPQEESTAAHRLRKEREEDMATRVGARRNSGAAGMANGPTPHVTPRPFRSSFGETAKEGKMPRRPPRRPAAFAGEVASGHAA
jgi:hypothetical protein